MTSDEPICFRGTVRCAVNHKAPGQWHAVCVDADEMSADELVDAQLAEWDATHNDERN
jgi:hypothetical protein